MNQRKFAVARSKGAVEERAKLEGELSGLWPNWPFKEIRIPYRERAGEIHWPNNGPLCVHIYVTAEWTSDESFTHPKAKYKRDLSRESEQSQYTFKRATAKNRGDPAPNYD